MNKPVITILVTGARGQLGQELAKLDTPDNVRIIGLDRSELDITNAESSLEVIQRLRPDIIIHAAAYTAVDRAEFEPDTAYEVNVKGTQNIAIAAEYVGARFCYISTDYVFDGKESSPYREDHSTGPQTVYGRTKLEGEQIALSSCSRTFVVRTSWVYGKYGNNFVRTMLQLGQQRSELAVVDDQIGSPTYTYDLAIFLLELTKTEQYGIYHASNVGVCSWFDFAKAIFEEAEMGTKVNPCSTEQFPRPAPRPRYSVLDHSAIRSNGFSDLRPWREGLHAFIQDLTPLTK